MSFAQIGAASGRLGLKRALPAMPKDTQSRSEQVAQHIENVREWITMIENDFNVSKIEIAERSGVSHSTIYRWFQDDFANEPSFGKLKQIADHFKIGLPGAHSQASQMSESESSAYVGPLPGMPELQPDQFDRMVHTRALEMAGYLPGDIVRVDGSIAAQSGDAVYAQIYSNDHGGAETVLRIYKKPFLIVRTADPTIDDKPILVDETDVRIVGPIIQMIRRRTKRD